jgi:hypothetical protein
MVRHARVPERSTQLCPSFCSRTVKNCVQPVAAVADSNRRNFACYPPAPVINRTRLDIFHNRHRSLRDRVPFFPSLTP